ncbi:MAG: glycosyltransferase family 2 protein [Patescibacteria group bacterium]
MFSKVLQEGDFYDIIEGLMKMKLTVIVLDFFKAKRVLENVRLLLLQKTNFDFDILVIDNSHNKENARILKEGLMDLLGERLELIINEKNKGYIRAHNEAFGKVKGEYMAIINPDILLKEADSLQKMVDFMEKNPKVGILGPKQINDNGQMAMNVRAFPKLYIQVARRTFFRHLPFFKEKVAYDEMRHLDYSKIQDVDWLQSSCMLVRSRLWREIGGFNEKYFLFMADVELCFEAWKKGFRVVYFPEVKVYADGIRLSRGGFGRFFVSWTLRQHVLDAFRYRIKYLWQGNPRELYYQKNK